MKDALVNLSLCLSDIPKEQIKVSEKNGKKYLNITIKGRKEPDAYENNVYAIISQSKEDREAKVEPTYIGQGRYIEFRGNEGPAAVADMNYLQPDEDDGLPF